MPRLVPPSRERTPLGGTSDPNVLEPHGRSVSVPGSEAPVWDARHTGVVGEPWGASSEESVYREALKRMS